MGLSLKVFGDFALRDESGAALALPTRKTRALLGYLAANADKPQQRAKLVGLLWSNFSEKQARHNLSQALLSIRKLGDSRNLTLLDSNGEQLTLRSDAIDVDLVRFHALKAKDPAAAASLYDGPFLEGLTVPDPAFDDWLALTRSDFHHLACAALERSANDDSDIETAMISARRLVALEPLRESAHRRLIELLHESGDRTAALRQYHSCADILKSELSVEPDAVTISLYHSIKQDNSATIAALQAKTVTKQPTLHTQVSSSEKPSIAVLPFANLSGDPDQNYLANGIQLTIYATLIKVSGLFLITANSVANRQERKDVAEQAGRELGARYILEGAVQTAGSHIRVTVQLTDTQHQKVVWAEQFDRVLDDFFALQDEIALEILAELDIKLISGEEVRVFRSTLTTRETKELYYRGLSHFYAGTKADNATARELFKKVYSEEPESPEGPSLTCFTYWLDVFRGWTDDARKSLAASLTWAEKAAEFEANNGLPYIVLASDYLLKGRYKDALETCTKGYDYRPNCPAANGYLANILNYCGDPREAVIRAKEALRVLPNAPPWFTNVLAAACRENGDIENSIGAAMESLKRNADDIEARAILCSDYVLAGSLSDAKRFADEIMTLNPDFSIANYTSNQPFRDPATLHRLVDCLRKAGLPD
jgi:TolB-like protein/two-component SAPR family response regulator